MSKILAGGLGRNIALGQEKRDLVPEKVEHLTIPKERRPLKDERTNGLDF